MMDSTIITALRCLQRHRAECEAFADGEALADDDAIDRLCESINFGETNGTPFVFSAPAWTNNPSAATPGLTKARELADCWYPLAAQTGIHSMIEWCGVIGEYVRMLGVAEESGIPADQVDQHHEDCVVAIPNFMVEYFCEKLGCQLKPFIRHNPALWTKVIRLWFEGSAPEVFHYRND